MLAYAFRVLSEVSYANIKAEQFENTTNLLSAILDKGVTQLIKRGIKNDYVPITELSASPKGKINIAESIKNLHWQSILEFEGDSRSSKQIIRYIA